MLDAPHREPEGGALTPVNCNMPIHTADVPPQRTPRYTPRPPVTKPYWS